MMPVLFDLPEPDLPLMILVDSSANGTLSTTKKPKVNLKPYEPRPSSASRRKLRRKQVEQGAPVTSLPPIQQGKMFEMPVQHQGPLPCGSPESFQYPIPLAFDVPVPRHPMMGPYGSFAPNFDPYFGAQAVMNNIYNETMMRLSMPEGPQVIPSYPDEIPRECRPPGSFMLKAVSGSYSSTIKCTYQSFRLYTYDIRFLTTTYTVIHVHPVYVFRTPNYLLIQCTNSERRYEDRASTYSRESHQRGTPITLKL